MSLSVSLSGRLKKKQKQREDDERIGGLLSLLLLAPALTSPSFFSLHRHSLRWQRFLLLQLFIAGTM
jgi:hypothetical protein